MIKLRLWLHKGWFFSSPQVSVSTRIARVLGILGLGAAASLALSTCDVFKVGLGSKVDLNPPAISINTPVRNSSQSGDVTISGTSSDDICKRQFFPGAVGNYPGRTPPLFQIM